MPDRTLEIIEWLLKYNTHLIHHPEVYCRLDLALTGYCQPSRKLLFEVRKPHFYWLTVSCKTARTHPSCYIRLYCFYAFAARLMIQESNPIRPPSGERWNDSVANGGNFFFLCLPGGNFFVKLFAVPLPVSEGSINGAGGQILPSLPPEVGSSIDRILSTSRNEVFVPQTVVFVDFASLWP